jgi:hypothetical protein
VTTQLLLGVDRFHRANIGACAAVSANFRIYLVDVAFSDRFNGALVNACSASGAVFIYFISHDDKNLDPPRRIGLITCF